MRTSKALIVVMSAAVLLLSLSGCRKELCYDHSHWKVNVIPEWELVWERDYGRAWETSWNSPGGIVYDSLRPLPGTGIAAIAYSEDSTYNERHLPGEGGVLPLGEGRQSILFYNDNTEYIVFSSMNSYAEATATTRTRTRSTYSEVHGDESTVNSPDMLYGAWVEDFLVDYSPDADPRDMPVTLKPLVYSYVIIYEFTAGIEYVQLARGALAGMAKSVYLQDGRTGSEKVTVLFDETTIDNERGMVIAVVSTFGVPDFPDIYYPTKDPEVTGVFGLNLEVKLPNGGMKNFEFDISDQMSDQPRGGVIRVDGIEVDESDFPTEGGGFDVDVDGWGEYEDIELPL